MVATKTKARKPKKAAKVSNAVKKFVNKKLDAQIEDKYKYDGQNQSVNFTGQFIEFGVIRQGTAYNERVGQKLRLKHLSCRFNLIGVKEPLPIMNTSIAYALTMRIIIFRVDEQQPTFLVIDDFFQLTTVYNPLTTDLTLAYLNPANKHKYHVLSDKVYNFNIPSIAQQIGGGIYDNFPQPEIKHPILSINLHKYLREYNQTSTAGPDLVTRGQLFMFWCHNNDTVGYSADMDWNFRTTFEDA